MNLLALETSGAVGSAALARAGHVHERFIATPREQTALLLPSVQALCTEAGIALGELDAIAFGRGPGSFTGLRIAAAVTQGLALALGVRVVGISSLAAIAQRAYREHGIEHALVCVDARMGEVYWAEYAIEDGRPRLGGDERLGLPAAVAAPAATGWSAIGDAFARFGHELEPVTSGAAAVRPELAPTARDMLPLAAAELAAGRTLAPDEALPVYLRDASAWHRPER